MQGGGPRPQPPYRRHRATSPRVVRLVVVGLFALSVLALAAIAVASFDPFAPSAEERAAAYAAAWQAGDDRAAARLTDAPDAALAALTASRKGLDGARVRASVRDVSEDDDRASGTLEVRWQVPQIGAFAYTAPIALARDDDTWTVAWRPETVHPELTDATRLGTEAVAPERGAILDRRGRPLMSERAVTDIAVQTGEGVDPGETAARLAAVLDVDEDDLAARLGDAPPGRYVPVITLRRPAFERVEEQVRAIDGVALNAGTAPLAPTRTFARAVLGAVGPATAEQVERSEGRVRPGDEIGQWGLQARFENRLRGTVTRRVVRRSLATGAAVATLLERAGRDGRALRTTLDREVQEAAEAALDGVGAKAALVAVQPSSGDVLAVANRPAGSALNRAFEGLYPPGSTFKVVSTAALLRDGLDPDEIVECPATRTVDGRAFRNFEGGAAGAVPFRTDFALSCNTAFVGLARRLEPEALPDAARDFGLGEELELALPAAAASVPAPGDPVTAAASMIGQAEIVASPLAMAGVAATVAEGRWRAPRLLRGDPSRSGDPLPDGEAATLRELMRSVVTTGTGTALAGVPGEVGGKSGTAEYGSGDPPPTHAWFIAHAGDVAISVLVEGGRAGGEVAAPIAAEMLSAIAGAPPG